MDESTADIPQPEKNRKFKHPIVGDWDKWVVMGQAIALDGRISDGAKALYWALACYRNNQSGYSWPSMGTLVKCLGRSKDTIRRLRAELETWGLLDEYQSKSGRVRYRIKPYSRAMEMNRRREQRGRKVEPHTNEDTEWTKTTPDPEQIHPRRKPYAGHKSGCMCVQCQNERNPTKQTP